MKPTTKFGLIFSGLYAATKFVVSAMDFQVDEAFQITVFANILILMTGLYLGLRAIKKVVEQSTFLEDVKTAMQTVVIYAILTALFNVFYYKVIETDYFSQRMDVMMQSQVGYFNKEYANDEQVAEFKNDSLYINEARLYEIDSSENTKKGVEALRGTKSSADSFYNLSFSTPLSLIADLVLGLFYSLLITFLLRKMATLNGGHSRAS